jgi:glyoxylase-like metal-dependent hydrolase (beta-lactamase superfamily II)
MVPDGLSPAWEFIEPRGFSMMRRTLLGRAGLAAFLSAAVVGGAAAPAGAAAPQVGTQAPGFYRARLGEFELTVLLDGSAPLEPVKLLTHIKPERVTSLLTADHLTSSVETSINAYLINTGSKLILVDAGSGEVFGPAAGHLVANLRAAGYEPEQVDDILITHLHYDHSGGLVIAGKQVFPNAVVHADKHDVDYWLDEANEAKAPEGSKPLFQDARRSLTPYAQAGRLAPFEGNTELAPGIKTFATPGHTPGHAFYVAESQGQKIVFWGDLVHVGAVQFPEPSATFQSDTDSKAAAAQRAKAFADAARQGHWVGAAHVPFPGLGHLRAQGKGYAWVPANYSVPK